MNLATIITVLIIDTGVSSVGGLGRYVANTMDNPSYEHGNHVTYIATGLAQNDPVCENVRFVQCNFMPKGETLGSPNDCLRYAIANNFDYVNMSLSGPDYDKEEKRLIKELTDKGTIVTVAAGNTWHKDISKVHSYPASYLYDGDLINFKVVADHTHPQQNWGPQVIHAQGTFTMYDKEVATGSSMAAPAHLHKLLMKRCAELKQAETMCKI